MLKRYEMAGYGKLAHAEETYYHDICEHYGALYKEGSSSMIFENTGLDGLKSDLAYLDESAEKAGFVRWQWEYYRATYDYKIEDSKSKNEYFLRINTRVIEGKLEKPDTILSVEAVYIGRATFPHGLEYESEIPAPVMSLANEKIKQLKELLEA